MIKEHEYELKNTHPALYVVILISASRVCPMSLDLESLILKNIAKLETDIAKQVKPIYLTLLEAVQYIQMDNVDIMSVDIYHKKKIEQLKK